MKTKKPSPTLSTEQLANVRRQIEQIIPDWAEHGDEVTINLKTGVAEQWKRATMVEASTFKTPTDQDQSKA